MKTDLAPWVARRILQFLNSAQKPVDLVFGVLDDPGDKENRSFTMQLARRVLLYRDTLPGKRFQTLDQLIAVRGLDPDKLDDLAYTFGVSAATAFAKALFECGLLLNNWTVLRYEWTAESDQEFQQFADDPVAFRQVVWNLATRACMETAGPAEAEARSLTTSLQTDYIDIYHNGTEEAAYAFALWFYRFDADNWFTFEGMFDQTEAFFSHHSGAFLPLQLRLFKGFNNRVLLDQLVGRDLPVTVDYSEHVITLWVVGLRD
ncbi:MAG: helix-hairpin-helix domain-containing protein [Saprospiraceae bacterium]|nr:helix-hairpin-helix domain-containing protein [Saprospiraceae bacterium]